MPRCSWKRRLNHALPLAALPSLLWTAPTSAAPAKQDSLGTLLERKYGKSDGFNKALNTIFAQRGPTTTPVPFEGRKPDGSYWWGAYFGNGNVVVLSWPHKTLQKACAARGGSLTRIMPYSLDSGPPVASVALSDGASDDRFMVTSMMLRAWSAADAQTASFREDAPPSLTGPSRNATLVDERGILGVFSCGAGALPPFWHVAILPTPHGHWQGFSRGIARQDSWVLLRIFEVDRALVERTAKAFAAAREARQTANQAAALAVKRADEAEAERMRIEGPTIAAFQRGVAIGSEINCGLVLGFNGPLVEVQVPVGIKLPNGAARVFVKRAALASVQSSHRCYQYSYPLDEWDIGPVITTGSRP